MSQNTKLDANQVIKMVYDEATQSLKTTVGGSDGDGLTNAELRASPVPVTVTSAPPTTIVVDAADDSIAIGDRVTGDLMTVNTDGSTNTNIVGVTPISGRLPVDLGASVVNITGPVTIPGEVEVVNDVGNPLSIQATSLPLPTGAATSALQTTANNSLASIDFKLTNPLEISGSVSVDNFPASQDVVVTSSALPTGAATSALQTDANASLTSIDSKLTSPLAVTGPLTDTELRATPVPVSGTVIVTGSATEAEQQLQTAELQAINANLDVSLSTRASETTLSDLNSKVVTVDTSDVTVTSSALPTGASTSALQTTGNASLASIDSKLTSPLQIESTDLDIRDLAFSTDKVDVSGSAVSVTNFPASQDVVVTSSALPTGAATLVEQQIQTSQLDSIDTSLLSIDSKLTSPITVQATNLDTRDLTFISDKVDVTGSTVALDSTTLAALENINVTVLNEVEVKNDVGNPLSVTMASSPLPTGAATEATLADLNSKVVTVDTDNVIIVSTVLAPDAATETEQQAQTALLTNIDTNLIKADTDNVTVIASALPTGAATLSEQQSQTGQLDTMVSQLASIDSKLTSPITIQATNLDIRDLAFATDKVDVSNSVVALDAATLAALENTTVTVSNPGLTDAELRAAPVPVSGSVSVSNFPASQDVVVTSSTLPTGAATSALQTTANASLSSIDSKLTGPLAVTGPLTDTQLRASPVPVSGTVSVSNPGLTDTELRASPVAVSAASLPLPTGASTAALQTTGNASLSSIDSKLTAPLAVTGPLTDAQLRATPVPVSGTVAISNSSIEISNDIGNPVPVNGTVTSKIQDSSGNVLNSNSGSLFVVGGDSSGIMNSSRVLTVQGAGIGSIPMESNVLSSVLPTGAATSTLQSTGNTSLNSIDTKLNTYNNSIAVTDISNNSAVNGAVTVTNAATAINVGGSNLANRKNITIYNNSATPGNILYYGFSAGVTTANGFPLARNTSVSFELGPNVTVYLISATGSHNVRVVELS